MSVPREHEFKLKDKQLKNLTLLRDRLIEDKVKSNTDFNSAEYSHQVFIPNEYLIVNDRHVDLWGFLFTNTHLNSVSLLIERLTLVINHDYLGIGAYIDKNDIADSFDLIGTLSMDKKDVPEHPQITIEEFKNTIEQHYWEEEIRFYGKYYGRGGFEGIALVLKTEDMFDLGVRFQQEESLQLLIKAPRRTDNLASDELVCFHKKMFSDWDTWEEYEDA